MNESLPSYKIISFEEAFELLLKAENIFDILSDDYVRLQVKTEWEFDLLNINKPNDKYSTNFFKANNNNKIIFYTVNNCSIIELEDWNETTHKIQF